MADLNLDMFKAYDIRTPADQLTPELAERLAWAEARYFKDVLGVNKVVLAREARITGPAYLEQGIRVFRDAGMEVIVNPQVSSTCLFYYSCLRNPDAAGIMYGASHNPAKDTGQKIVGPGLQPIAMHCGPAGGLVEIRRLYNEGKNQSGSNSVSRGKLVVRTYLDEYITRSLKLAGVTEGSLGEANLLLDFLSGAAGTEFTQALTYAGANLSVYNLVPDGRFPSGAPNPVVPESVAPSLQRLREGNFDFGMFFDGDGDRVDVMHPDGNQVSPAFNFCALAPHLKKVYADAFGRDFHPQVYADLKANPLAIVGIAQHGFGVHVIRNGHSQIKEALRKNWKNQFVAAVEESAHYYMNDCWSDTLNIRNEVTALPLENTLFYGLLTARIWMENPTRYSELQQIQYETFREREWGYRFPSDQGRFHALSEVENAFKAMGGDSMSRMADGMDLEATLMRHGLPFVIDANTRVEKDWTQVAQRVSQSEQGLARWEVTAGTLERKEEMVAKIEGIAGKYGAGPRYVG